MPSRGKKYGNASQVTTHVDSYRDGGKVKKKKKRSLAEQALAGGKMTGKALRGVGQYVADKAVTPALKKAGYQDGGKVKKKKVEPKPEMLGTGAAAKAGETLRSKRKKQMEELGL